MPESMPGAGTRTEKRTAVVTAVTTVRTVASMAEVMNAIGRRATRRGRAMCMCMVMVMGT
jgi:uncharacterized membrane protein